jgi:hypothetical protein
VAGAGGGSVEIGSGPAFKRDKKNKKPQKPYMEPDGLQEAVTEVMNYILLNNC